VNRIHRATVWLLSVTKTKAIYYVEFILGLILIAQGVVELFPEGQLPQGSFEVLPAEWGEIAFSAFQTLAGLMLIVGVIANHQKWARSLRRLGSFMAFLAMLFLSFLGIISEGVNDLYWIATIGLTLLCGAIYIRAGWDTDE